VAQASPAIVATNSAEPVAPFWHTVLFVLIFLALGVADALRIQHTPGVYPHRMRTYIFSIAFEWGMVAYVWWFGLRPRGKLMSDLIGGRWARLSDFFRDVGVAFLFWLVVVAMLIMSRFLLGPNPAATKAIKLLSPRTGAEMIVWVLVSVTAGITEEFLFRGYLQRQLLAVTKSPHAAVVLQATVFGAVHLYQGWKGAVGITIYGALFGVLALMRRSLLPGMMQHTAQDTFSGIAASLLSKRGYM
jgi:CAAX protease family protein